MKKNGFIATSLIYSFFLIFITLFLTIIADYLQNKVLLNTIEKGIKDEINSTMSIEDFEVGDMISFVSDCSSSTIENPWVVANVNYNDKSIVFYSYDFVGTLPTGFLISGDTSENLTKNHFDNDIQPEYKNNTYYNKLIYTFDTSKFSESENKNYNIGTNMYATLECTTSTTEEYKINNNCIISTGNTYTRKRIMKKVGTNKYTKCVEGGDGSIILDVIP